MAPEARIQTNANDAPGQQKLSKAIDDNSLAQIKDARHDDVKFKHT